MSTPKSAGKLTKASPNNSNLVYSTEAGDQRRSSKKPAIPAAVKPGSPIKMRLETGGRGGKAVTVLFNLALSEDEALSLMKAMQSKFGCGGTYKDGTIELRGDVRQRVEEFLSTKSMKVVRAGG